MIEQLRREVDDRNYYLDNSEQALGYSAALDDIEKFLDTFSEEPDKNLEAEIQWYLREKCSGDDEPTVSEIARYFAKWQYQKDRGEFAKIRAKIWCEGFDAHKEQMLKNAVEASVNTYELTPGGSAYVEFVADMLVAHFRSNDKVRIVVLKDEEK